MKRNYSYNDHYTFGWGDGTYNFDDRNGMYWVKYGRASRPVMSFKEECLNAARLIGETAEKPIMVFASGGCDSEIIQRCFLEVGVPFESVTANLIYSGEVVNRYDTCFVEPFVKEYNIKHHYIDNDLDELFESRYYDSAKKYQTWMPGSILQAEWAARYCKDYLCVFGLVDDLLLKRASWLNITEHKEMVVVQEPSVVSVLHAVSEMNETAIVSFFCYTPEQMLSWFTSEDVRVFANYDISFPKFSMYGLKPFIYFKHWPELSPRPKATGYDQIEGFSSYAACMENELVKKALALMEDNQLVTYCKFSDVLDMLKVPD